MILRARLWFVILAAAEAVIAILVYGDAHSSVRVVAVLFFLLICPGMAWIRLLQLYEPVTERSRSPLASRSTPHSRARWSMREDGRPGLHSRPCSP